MAGRSTGVQTMAIRVKTVSGRAFCRCGMWFGRDHTWTTVPDEKLDERFATPGPATPKDPTIREILEAEPALVCEAEPAGESSEEPS